MKKWTSNDLARYYNSNKREVKFQVNDELTVSSGEVHVAKDVWSLSAYEDSDCDTCSLRNVDECKYINCTGIVFRSLGSNKLSTKNYIIEKAVCNADTCPYYESECINKMLFNDRSNLCLLNRIINYHEP